MKLTEKEGDFKELSANSHPARCIGVVDIGVQASQWGNKDQLVLMFEVPGETIERDGVEKPLGMNVFYTKDLHPKSKLGGDLTGWRGRPFTDEEKHGFEIKNVLDKICILNVYHDENGKAKLRGIGNIIKGIEVPPASVPLIYFSIDEHGCSGKEYASLPEWLQKIVDKRVVPGSKPQSAGTVDDPPLPEGSGEKGSEAFDDIADLPF